ncbi:MAG TPA: hypothetical protein VE733_01740 [Streptosporangiaceae bacterium]|nr:hypothetical protein [Streptosporangiaceae bacterium]
MDKIVGLASDFLFSGDDVGPFRGYATALPRTRGGAGTGCLQVAEVGRR